MRKTKLHRGKQEDCEMCKQNDLEFARTWFTPSKPRPALVPVPAPVIRTVAKQDSEQPSDYRQQILNRAKGK